MQGKVPTAFSWGSSQAKPLGIRPPIKLDEQHISTAPQQLNSTCNDPISKQGHFHGDLWHLSGLGYQLLSHMYLSVTPRTVACQAPLSMGILQARVLEWVDILSSRHLPDPEIEPRSSALQADSLPSEPPGKTHLFGMADTFKPIKRWNIQSWKPPQPKIHKSITVMFPEPRTHTTRSTQHLHPTTLSPEKSFSRRLLASFANSSLLKTSSRTFPIHHQVYLLLFHVLVTHSCPAP